MVDYSFYWRTLIAFVACMTLQVIFFRVLKTKYPKEYERIGSPGFFRNNNFSTALSTLWWLFTFQYRRLHPAFALFCFLSTIVLVATLYFIFAYPVYVRYTS